MYDYQIPHFYFDNVEHRLDASSLLPLVGAAIMPFITLPYDDDNDCDDHDDDNLTRTVMIVTMMMMTNRRMMASNSLRFPMQSQHDEP